MPHKTHRAFTQEELDFIWEHRDDMSLSAIARALGREKSGVGYKLRAMLGGQKERVYRTAAVAAEQKYRHFTLAEDRMILIDRYLGPAELGRKLNRPRWSIVTRLQLLDERGITYFHRGPFESPKRRVWTEREIDYLCDVYGLVALANIAATLGRSKVAVVEKAHVLRLVAGDQFLNPIKVAEIFGVLPATVHNWMKRGHIRAHRSAPIYNETKGNAWVIPETELRRFITEHADLYDIRKMDAEFEPWYSLARQAQSTTPNRGRFSIWSDFEIGYLNANYLSMSDQQIGAALRRSRVAVRHKREILGLHKITDTDKSAYNPGAWPRSHVRKLVAEWGNGKLKDLAAQLGYRADTTRSKGERLGLPTWTEARRQREQQQQQEEREVA